MQVFTQHGAILLENLDAITPQILSNSHRYQSEVLNLSHFLTIPYHYIELPATAESLSSTEGLPTHRMTSASTWKSTL